MRGTGYAIAEIIWWMLAAAVIGGIIGWIMRYWIGGGRSRKEISEELGMWKVKGEGLVSDLETKTAELESLRGHRAELESALAAANKAVADTQARAAQLDAELSTIGADRNAENLHLESQAAGLSGLASALGDREALVAELQGSIADLESRLTAVSGELSPLQEAHAACGVVADGHIGRIAALESQLAELERENAELSSRGVAQSDSRGLGADLEALAAAEEDDTDASDQMALESASTGIVKAAAPPTRFGTAGADHEDDLKVIGGIGPKLEGVLNSYGIVSWEQLAALSDAEVLRVDEGLEDFPGRIQRDEWVEQARDLVKRFPDRSRRPNRTSFLNEPPS